MIETLSVSLSAPAFSFLLYENMKNKHGQEGFLIGEIVEKEKKTITDNDQRQVHISRTIKINSSMPCPQLCYFYDGVGRVDAEKVKSFLGDLAPKVVAWYKYKPSSSFKFTFREILVHKQLANLFEIIPEYFTCCLMISEMSDNGSTHTWTQNFIRYNNSISSEYLPLHIVNLSDPNNLYKSPEAVSETFHNLLNGLKINHAKTQGLTIITKIQSALEKHTKKTAENLAEAEKRLFQLEKEVHKIKQVIQQKKEQNHGLVSSIATENQLNELNIIEKNEDEVLNELPSKRQTRGRGTQGKKRGLNQQTPKINSTQERTRKKN